MTTSRTSPSTERRPSSRSGTSGAPAPRSLPAAAALGAATGAAITLLICMAVAVIGWFLADAGAHGRTTDALRIGADGWLMGLGAPVRAGGTPLGIAPLALTAMTLLATHRAARWAGRGAVPAVARAERSAGTADKAIGTAALLGGLVYVVAAIVVTLLADHPSARPDLGRACLGGLVVGVVGVGTGLAVGTGWFETRWRTARPALRAVVGGAVTAVGLLVAAGACLVAVSLLVSFNEAGRLFSALELGTGDALMLCVVTALFAPNAALLGVAYLVGPGFAVGTGTTVSVGAVALGPLPAFPVLAALPTEGTTPGWLPVLLAVPPLCAALAAGLAQRRSGETAWDGAALRAFGVGAVAAVAVVALVALAGGPIGTGRMAHVGAPVGQVLVTALGGMALGGLVGGLVVTWWQRRHAAD